MTSFRPLRSALWPALALSLLCGHARAAGEAPDPFDDYDTSHPETPPVEAVATPTRPGREPAAPDAADLPWRRGQLNLAGLTTLSYAGSNSDLLDGSSQSNRNFFFRLSPHVGYFVLDQVELGASIGWLTKSINREGKTLSSEGDFLVEATASYVVPVSTRFALVPGAGLGFYTGSSSRLATVAGKQLDEQTSTRGIAFSLYPMLAYQITREWQLRSGLAVSLLYGSEKITSADTRLGTSAAYVSLPFQLTYIFR